MAPFRVLPIVQMRFAVTSDHDELAVLTREIAYKATYVQDQTVLIEVLELEDITPADIDPDAPLFYEGLGLDSIDALELGVALQKRYGISLSSNSEDARRHFASVRALGALISNQRTK